MSVTTCTQRKTFWHSGCACTRASAKRRRLLPWSWSANPRSETGETRDDIHQVRPVLGGGEAWQREPAERPPVANAMGGSVPGDGRHGRAEPGSLDRLKLPLAGVAGRVAEYRYRRARLETQPARRLFDLPFTDIGRRQR